MRGRDIDRNSVLKHYEGTGHLARKSLCQELFESSEIYSDHVAVIADDAHLTYAQLEQSLCVFTEELREIGLSPGDHVLLQLPNTAAYVVTLLALMRVGAIPTLLLPAHREAEVAALCESLHPVAYIGGRDHLGFDTVAMVEAMGPGELGLKELWADNGPTHDKESSYRVLPGLFTAPISTKCSPPTKWPDPRSVALNLLSGGTTNMPKIIPRVHEAYAYNTRAAAQCCGVGPDTVYLAVLSTSHDFALAQPGILGTLLSGGTVVLCTSAAFDEAFPAIATHGVTLTALVPAVAEVWVEAAEWFPADFSSLERIIIGAAALNDGLGEAIQDRFGVRIHQGYGMGEGITTFTRIDDPPAVILGTQGRPISDADELVIDGPGGEPGEILEKGPYTFFGYEGNRDTPDCFTEDGFFRTGDRGYLTEDGNLVLYGRVVEQINRLGENVSPSEVETLLSGTPGISAAAVFPMPDRALGERTVAAIVAQPGVNRSAILDDFLTRGVARYKVPDQVITVDEIPLINIGKVDKKKLRALAAAQFTDRESEQS